MKRCTSCGRTTKNFASFPCPNCDAVIVRCVDCRENKNLYKCQCGTTGP